jgi:hypothetical protein
LTLSRRNPGSGEGRAGRGGGGWLSSKTLLSPVEWGWMAKGYQRVVADSHPSVTDVVLGQIYV